MSTTQTALILSLISTIGLVAGALVALSKRISESECCCCKARFSTKRSTSNLSRLENGYPQVPLSTVVNLEEYIATDKNDHKETNV